MQNRANLFQAKIQAANAAGLAGYVIWVDSPFYTTDLDVYAIDDGVPPDPTEAVLGDALQGYPTPPATVPEAPWAAAYGGLALVLFGGAIVWARRRKETAPLAGNP